MHAVHTKFLSGSREITDESSGLYPVEIKET
jgi:hypothetical protein